MKIAFFSSKNYDQNSFTQANAGHAHDMTFFEAPLNANTASLAEGFGAVCVFVNDHVNREVLELLKAGGTELVVLRGF